MAYGERGQGKRESEVDRKEREGEGKETDIGEEKTERERPDIECNAPAPVKDGIRHYHKHNSDNTSSQNAVIKSSIISSNKSYIHH